MNKRILKFRAWHIPTKRMFKVFTFGDDVVFEDSLDGVYTSPTLPAERKDCEVMQFTGLYDKNKKPIYEYDVIKFTEHGGCIFPSFHATVEYDDECGGFGYYETSTPVLFQAFARWDELQEDLLNHVEVVCNIYEFPEKNAPKKKS